MRFVEVGAGEVRLRRGEAPRPRAGEALIRVEACGVCGSDLRLVRGMVLPRGAGYPLRPGHEVAGVVEELGPGAQGVHTGDRVVLHPLSPCGRCIPCLGGREERCGAARVLGLQAAGGMADLVTWPASRMVPVPALPADVAALLPDAVATAYHAVRMADLRARSRLCVIGAGGVGTHVVQLARVLHPHVQVAAVVRSEASADRLRTAGVIAVVSLEGAALRLRERVGRFDAVVDFSGVAGAAAEGIRMLEVGGRLVLGSVVDEAIELGTTITGVTTRELHVMGCYVSTLDDLHQVAMLVAGGGLELSGSVTHRLPLDRAPQGFALLERRPAGLVRIVLLP